MIWALPHLEFSRSLARYAFSDSGVEVLLLLLVALGCIVHGLKEMRISSSIFKRAVPIASKAATSGRKTKSVTFDIPAVVNEDDELQGVFSPSSSLLRSNQSEATFFENENCTGSLLFMHRPTDNPVLEKSGRYPYADHFVGRKRLWEARVQLKFKHTPSAPVVFGIELDDYVPLTKAAKPLMGVVVAALRRVVGNDLYHSVGDDPSATDGPQEKPVFVMPLWAFDQFIVTPEGEEAPDLADPRFHELGKKRADDRTAFIKEISAIELKSGPTYTFAFWGISQFLDNINWEVVGVVPFTKVNFNQFCGRAPVHLVMYSLRSGSDDKDMRHLQSRKQYYFDLKFWSSKFKPTPQRLKELLPSANSRSITVGNQHSSDGVLEKRSCASFDMRRLLATMCT